MLLHSRATGALVWTSVCLLNGFVLETTKFCMKVPNLPNHSISSQFSLYMEVKNSNDDSSETTNINTNRFTPQIHIYMYMYPVLLEGSPQKLLKELPNFVGPDTCVKL